VRDWSSWVSTRGVDGVHPGRPPPPGELIAERRRLCHGELFADWEPGMDDLEARFHRAMIDIYEKAQRETVFCL